MTQEERLDSLIRGLLEEEGRNPEAEMPSDKKEKEDLLRSLMNVRKPKPLSADWLRIQDDYLQTCLEEHGITDADALPACSSDAPQQGSRRLLRHASPVTWRRKG